MICDENEAKKKKKSFKKYHICYVYINTKYNLFPSLGERDTLPPTAPGAGGYKVCSIRRRACVVFVSPVINSKVYYILTCCSTWTCNSTWTFYPCPV